MPAESFTETPMSLRERVAGALTTEVFEESGLRTVEEWASGLAVLGKTFHHFSRIVDFGCGCGRALRPLAKRLLPTQTLIGADVDQEAVDWVETEFGLKAIHLPDHPPAPIESNSIDLVLSHSVFTHLPEEVQFQWLHELHRWLAPGAIAMLSIHGGFATAQYENWLRTHGAPDELATFRKRFARNGFFYVKGRALAEQTFPEYYGAAFHSQTYIKDEWLDRFDLVAWLPRFALDYQDVLVLRKKT